MARMFVIFFWLSLAHCLWIVSGNNASWPRPGPSWLQDDGNIVEPALQQNTKYKPKISFTNRLVKNAFATFTCDEAVEKQMVVPLVVRRRTKAFDELKKSLEKIINLPLTDSEVLKGIHYYNSHVLKQEPQCRISWKTPEARAALLRYKTEMEVERILSPHRLLKPDIIDSTLFKEFKRSIETIFGYTFDSVNLHKRASDELSRITNPKSGSSAVVRQSMSGSTQGHASTSAESSSPTSVQFSPEMNPSMLVDWNHPEVARTYFAFQVQLPKILPLISDRESLMASVVFQKFKRAVEMIYNCRFSNNFFYDLVFARICYSSMRPES